MRNEFSTFDIMKILDVKRERLREWMNQGFITPTIPAEGVGSKAIFNLLDIYKIAVFKILVDAGINRRKASKLVSENPKLCSHQEVERIVFITVFEIDTGVRWESYMEPGPWKMEQEINKNTDWDIGIMINFKRIRNRVKKLLDSS